MKILIVVGIFPPDIGGPATFVPLIANRLVGKGYSVTVVCLSDKLNHEDNLYNFKIHRIKRRQNLILRWLKTISAISKYGINSNLIFVNGLPMESYISNILIRKKTIRKVVGDWAWERGRNLNLTSDGFDEFQNNSHNLHLEIAKFSRGWTAKKADLVITPSKHLKHVVNNWGVKKENIKVIYNGTKIMPFDIKKDTNFKKVKLLTVGRLAPFKNIDRIILSLNELKDVNFDLELTIAGDGPERNNLESIVKYQNLGNKVKFTGQLDEKELGKVYKNSDIYIQASGYEGLPHTLLEAISYNLSIISTPIGGTNEILKDNTNGWTINLVKGKFPSETDIANKIMYILENKNEDFEKKERARNLLQSQFNKEENFNLYLKIIEEVTKNG
jgi:glycosyltransferase involved in cell wall biosynthesis